MKFNSYKNYFIETLHKIDPEQIDNVINLIYNAFLSENTIFIIGNGGSAANASHFAEDLTKYTCMELNQIKRIKALSLTDNLPWISALSNDIGYEVIFEQQLKTFAKENDILIAISGSGNSPNIIKAVEWANANKIITIGVSGFNGGKLIQMVQNKLHIPLNDMCTSESIHLLVFHYIVIKLQEIIKEYFDNKSQS